MDCEGEDKINQVETLWEGSLFPSTLHPEKLILARTLQSLEYPILTPFLRKPYARRSLASIAIAHIRRSAVCFAQHELQ